ncbi:MAG: hypothetical protein ABJ242_04750 [Marinomonas sp.]
MKKLNLLVATMASLLVLACNEAPASDDASAHEADASAKSATETPTFTAESDIDWGSDLGEFANDGECDDKRFEGAGMTDTELLDEDVKTDASDCRTAFEAGRLKLRE